MARRTHGLALDMIGYAIAFLLGGLIALGILWYLDSR